MESRKADQLRTLRLKNTIQWWVFLSSSSLEYLRHEAEEASNVENANNLKKQQQQQQTQQKPVLAKEPEKRQPGRERKICWKLLNCGQTS